MKNYKSLFSRFLSKFTGSAMLGSLVTVIVFYLIILFLIVKGSHEALIIGAIFLICNLGCIGGVCIYNIKKGFHPYDSELIGDSFIGVSKKCRDFNECLEALFGHMPNRALNGFKAMEEEYGDTMSADEKAVVYFYIARCYDLLKFYPNAYRYYKLSAESGFTNGVLKFLTARCVGSLGDTEAALTLYDEVISDRTNQFVPFVRTDIGKMYINLNDGKNAYRWYSEAVNRHENYAEALGGAAVALLLLHRFVEAEEMYNMAVLNRIKDIENFKKFYHDIYSMEQSKTVSAEK